MTTNDEPTKHEDWPVLIAGQWDDYANIAYLTDKEHRLPDWILRLISGEMRSTSGSRNERMLARQALGYLRNLHDLRARDELMDVESQWRFLILCSEIGFKQVISEYENQRETDRVEEGDQSS